MRTKTLNRLTFMSLILVVLIVIFVAKDGFNFLSYSNSSILANAQEALIKELVIDDGAQSTRLSRKEEQWVVTKGVEVYKADQERANALASHIASLQKEGIVSNNPAKHAEFGIGKQKLIVTLPNKIYTIYIGNNAGLSKNYARIDNQDEVFETEGFTDVFTPIDYRDLSVGIVDDETRVQNIEIIQEGVPTKLTFNGNDWQSDGQKVVKERVSFYINDLKTLEAEDILSQAQAIDTPSLTITVAEGGQTKTAEFFPQGDDYNLKVSGHDQIFLIDAAHVEDLKKTAADFIE